MTARASTTAEFRQRGDLEVLTWPVFDRFPVDVLVSTRNGGVSSSEHGNYGTLNLSFSVGDSAADVLENRRRVASSLGTDLASFVFQQQIHGRGTQVVSTADRGRGAEDGRTAVPQTDALVTNDPGTVLAALAADCVTVVLYDPSAHVLACVHAGWRGTVARVTQAAVHAMTTLGTRPSDIIAGIGPAVAPGTYQVGGEVKNAAEATFGLGAASLLRPDGPGKWLFDLWAANRLGLREAGVPDEQIHTADVPTGPDPGMFFSHRAEQPCGRFAAVATLGRRSGT